MPNLDKFYINHAKLNGFESILSGTATVVNVLSGNTFYNTDSNAKLTGSMPDNGATIITPSTSNQNIAAGYHNGSGYVKGDSNLVTANIKAGVSIFGISGKSSVVETNDATAIAGNILNAKTAYINGSKVVGSMVNNYGLTGLAPWGVSGGNGYVDVVPTAGYYDNGATIRVSDTNLTAANIKSGVTIFGVTGSLIPRKYATTTATGNNGNVVVTGLGFTPQFLRISYSAGQQYNFIYDASLDSSNLKPLYGSGSQSYAITITSDGFSTNLPNDNSVTNTIVAFG